jgi:hypothetical protein
VLGGRSPDEVVRERPAAGHEPRQPRYRPPPTLASCPGHAGRRARQGRLAARQLALPCQFRAGGDGRSACGRRAAQQGRG